MDSLLIPIPDCTMVNWAAVQAVASALNAAFAGVTLVFTVGVRIETCTWDYMPCYLGLHHMPRLYVTPTNLSYSF